MPVDETGDASGKRTDHLRNRATRSAVRTTQHGLRVAVRVIRCRLLEVPSESSPVDLQIPAPTRTAGTKPCTVAERHVPVLPAGPGRSLRRYAVDDQRAADTHLDDEVQRRTSSRGSSSSRLRHTT